MYAQIRKRKTKPKMEKRKREEMRRGSASGKQHVTPPQSPMKRAKRGAHVGSPSDHHYVDDEAACAPRESESADHAANLAKMAKFQERASRHKGRVADAALCIESQAPVMQAPATQAPARSIEELTQLATSFKTPTSTAECVPTPAAFLNYISKHVVAGKPCPPAQDEGFLVAHRLLVAVGDLSFAPEELTCPGCAPCVFGCDVLSEEEAALMGIKFQGSVVCE